ncbi:MAG: aminotransferase class V-fold PLP-dependent enzyme [Bacteroidota bacterium]|nr:aminotransferase class V-fold PLP-dependent enzyme [Bacteroidota bacterium]
MHRRNLFSLIGAASAGVYLNPSDILLKMEERLRKAFSNANSLSEINPDSEEFWNQLKQAYSVSPSIINLNNGGVAPSPRVVQEAVEYYNRLCNEAPSYYMWRILDQGREPLREKMAAIAGCSAEEIAFNRNSSEALETIIFGLRLKAGDEVVLTKQDYPNMINAWKQREKRDGVILKWLNFEFPIENKSAIVSAFTNAFSSKTKVVQITHMINWMGQLLPAKEIAAAAHQKGIEVLVDAAHSFAHIPYKISDLDCDYFGTSLHKWLSAPFGSGLLYVKKDKIKSLYPLLAAADSDSSDIRKFENLGTRSFAIEQAIGHAIDFFQMIGPERKFKRLQFLKEYWVNKVMVNPKVKIHCPMSPEFGGAIGAVSVVGKTPAELSEYLFNQYKIHTVSIDWENIHCVRITPNVYTSLFELDKLVKGILSFANQA